MRSLQQLLDAAGIQLHRAKAGNHKTLCPACSAGRKHKADPCLSVLIDEKGLTFFCHNCNHSGGGFFDGGSRTPERRPNKKSPSGGYQKLQREAARLWR